MLNRTFVRNGTPHPPQTPEELDILPGVSEALAKLAALGLPLIVVTNQPDVARGTQRREVVERINALLMQQLPLAAAYACYHDNQDQCQCRKPGPGLLQQAAREHGIDLKSSFMVGDRWSDIAAGAAVGCKTFLINESYSQCHRCAPDFTVADLCEAAQRIEGLVRGADRAAV